MLILTILKWLVLLLLLLLGLLLFLVILVLFVPVRYRLDGSFIDEKADGTAKLSWLWHIVTADITYHQGTAVSGSVRLFGIRLYRIGGAAV